MALTRRARRRLALLGISLVVVVGLGIGAWFVQQSIKDARAAAARTAGMTAAEAGDWGTALSELSLAVARQQDDLEALLVFAEARSRVPEANNRHLVTAMKYYTRATDLARSTGVKPEILREALGGRARLELANRALVLLEATALEMLELDPADLEALDYLFEIRRSRGDYLPDSVDLVVRDGRTDEAWLQALRDSGREGGQKNNSLVALRWGLERLVLDPGNLDRREEVLGVLRDGGSVDLQNIRSGGKPESPIDVAKAWIAEAEPDDPMPLLVLATEYLIREQPEQARQFMNAAEAIGIDDPVLLLRGVGIREALRSPEDLQRAAELLAEAEEAALLAPAAAKDISIRHWNVGRSQDAFRMLDSVVDRIDAVDSGEMLDNLAQAAMLAALDGRPDAVDRLQTLQDEVERAKRLEPAVRDALDQVVRLTGIALVENPGLQDVELAKTAAATIPGNFLIQALFGDVLAAAGMQSLANQAWTRAGSLAGERSIPIGRRVVRGSLEDQSVEEAFRQAYRYAAGSPTITAVIGLCEAWLALEAVGLDAREVVPRFDESIFRSPLDLVQTLVDDLDDRDQDVARVLPLLADAAVRQGENETARGAIDRALAEDVPFPTLIRMAAISATSGLDRDQVILERLRDRASTEEELDRVAILEATTLRRGGAAGAALELIRARFGGRQETEARRTLGLEVLDHALVTRGPLDEAIEILLAVSPSEQLFRRLHRATIAAGDEEASRRLAVWVLGPQARTAADTANTGSAEMAGDSAYGFGRNTLPAVLAAAEHTLAFESDDPEAIRQAVLSVDPLVSTGNSNADLELALVRLLQASDPPQNALALEVLRKSRRMRPGRFDTAILMIELLQRDGRFEEAAEEIERLYRRRASAPVEIQQLLPAVLAGQGDPALVAESACELAQRTGRPMDLLECARAKARGGDVAEADRILDELLEKADRPFTVDIEAAARLVRRGDAEAGIALLRESTVFPSALRRDLALSGMLLQLGRWDDLAEVLDGLGADGEASADAQVIRAILLLNGPNPDVNAARVVLDRAVELAPEDPGILQRNVTIRLSNPDLRESALGAIEAFGRVRPKEAELLRLAFDASPDGIRFTASEPLVNRARELVRVQATVRQAWVLALEIVTAAFQQAIAEVEVGAANRYGEQLLEIAEGAVGRFPSDSAFPVQLSQIHLALGNEDDALAAAREGLQRVGDAARLGNAIPVAAVEMRMGRPESVIRTLEPFRIEIEEGAAERPQGWGLLFTALMQADRVDDAWSIFEARGGSGEANGLLPWFVAVESAPPGPARAAVDRVLEMLPPGAGRLPAVGALASVYRRTGDDRTRAMIESMIDDIESSDPGPTMAIRVRFVRLGLDEQLDPLGTLQGYAAMVDDLPAGTVDRLKRFQDLTDEERAETAPIANAAIMAMNNFAAMTASTVLEGRADDPAQIEALLDRAGEAADDLGIIMAESPEVLDTRAMVALARQEGGRAVELANQAIRKAPQKPGFRFTLARGLALTGDDVGALAQAREAIRLHRRAAEIDEDAVAKIQGFIDRMQG